jgi:hypothetical protein
MSHQPFESWILDETRLDEQQIQQLQAHLNVCPSCKTLQSSWEAVRHQLQSASEMQPAPGFSMRWQANLNKRWEEEGRLQQQNMIIASASTLVAFLIALVAVVFPRVSWIDVLIKLVSTLVSTTGSLSAFLQMISSAVKTVPASLLIFSALGTSTLLCLVGFLWGVSIWRMSHKGVRQNEK